jgi:[ribosomal protein S5]-alanine N-acetyltransferase
MLTVWPVLHFLFQDLNAHPVSLECDDTNGRSMRVAERCGVVREGHLRENRRRPDGSISRTYRYGMLRHDFYPRD